MHSAVLSPVQVWCPMTAEFYREYLKIRTRKRKVSLFCNLFLFSSLPFSPKTFHGSALEFPNSVEPCAYMSLERTVLYLVVVFLPCCHLFPCFFKLFSFCNSFCV